MLNQWLIVIPARLKSTRLPEKPLADLNGKPLVVRVYDKVAPLKKLGAQVLVATDSDRIVKACEQWGIETVMTREDHPSGTARVAEVAAKYQLPYVMNVQGDEPFINADDIKTLATQMAATPAARMGTLYYVNRDLEAFHNPNVVKVISDHEGYAIYFSRSPIPHHRQDVAKFQQFNQHLGVYAFKREAILQFAQWAPCALEQIESLEQLRALYHHMRIYLVEAKHSSIGIDTPEDLAHARRTI